MTNTDSRLARIWRVVWPHLSGQRARERKTRPQTYILASRRDLVWHVDLRDSPEVDAYIASLDGLDDDAEARTVVVSRSVYSSGDPALKVTQPTGELLGFISPDDFSEVSELLRVYEISRLRYHLLRELRFRVKLHAVPADRLRAELWVQDPVKLTDAYWVKEPPANRNNGF